MWFLASLLHTVTGHQRDKVDIVWSRRSLTHNVFRLWELIFWRKTGIRCEAQAHSDGWIKCYTWEAWIANKLEGPVVRLLHNIVQSLLILQSGSHYQLQRGAIGFDNSGTQQTPGLTPTISFTATGSNLEMALYPDDGSADNVTATAYGVQVPTVVDKQNPFSNLWQYSYHLTAPTAGTANATATATNSDGRLNVISYTGCDQSGTLDAHQLRTNATTSFVPAITTVAANCWVSMSVINDGGDATTSTGNTRQHAGNGRSCGDNGPVSPGSNAMTWGIGGGSANWGAAILSIAPAAAAGAATSRNLFTLLGVS